MEDRTGRDVRWSARATWVGIGLVVFMLALLFPATSDDWRRIGFPDRTLAGYRAEAVTSYNGHNGRVIGNTISFILIDPSWLRALAKALTVVALVLAIQRLVDAGSGARGRGRSVWLGLLVFAGVFLVPSGVFREAYVWSAGFFNYVPPLVGIIWLIGTLADRWPATRDTAGAGARCGVVSACTALFVEHVTVALVGLAWGGLALMLVRRRRPSTALVGWVVGATVGTAVMFASPGLRDVANHVDAYFSYPATLTGALEKAAINYATITTSFLFSNPLLVTWLAVLGLATGLRQPARAIGRSPRRWVPAGLGAAVAVYALVSRVFASDVLRCAGPTIGTCHRRGLAVDVGFLFLALTLVVLPGLRLLRGEDRVVFAGLLAATLLMLGPLLVVSPVGPRNLLGSTVTLVALLALLTRDMLAGEERRVRWAKVAIALAVLGGLVVLSIIQVGNARTAAERTAAMEQAVAAGADRVVLPLYPHPDWVHDARDPKIGNRYFKQAPGDIEIDFAS